MKRGSRGHGGANGTGGKPQDRRERLMGQLAGHIDRTLNRAGRRTAFVLLTVAIPEGKDDESVHINCVSNLGDQRAIVEIMRRHVKRVDDYHREDQASTGAKEDGPPDG